MYRYLIYKVLNKIFFSLSGVKKIAPMIYANFTPENVFDSQSPILEIKLNSPTTHLGDRLFLISIVGFCIDQNIKLLLDHDDDASRKIFGMFFGEGFKRILTCDSSPSMTMILAPSFLHLYKRINSKNLLVIDFNDHNSQGKLSATLLENFSRNFVDGKDRHVSYIDQLSSLSIYGNAIESKFSLTGNYYLFNNYIDSGNFRLYFINRRLLDLKCRSLKKLGFKIIHIGTHADKLNDMNKYEFVDLDLRGLISIEELILLVNSKHIVGAVTFDNFIMHLIGLANKRAFILFRGRFSKVKLVHHYKNVNPNFYTSSKIEYL